MEAKPWTFKWDNLLDAITTSKDDVWGRFGNQGCSRLDPESLYHEYTSCNNNIQRIFCSTIWATSPAEVGSRITIHGHSLIWLRDLYASILETTIFQICKCNGNLSQFCHINHIWHLNDIGESPQSDHKHQINNWILVQVWHKSPTTKNKKWSCTFNGNLPETPQQLSCENWKFIGNLPQTYHKLPIDNWKFIGNLPKTSLKMPIDNWKFIGNLPKTSHKMPLDNWKFIGNLPQTSNYQLEVYWKFTTNFQLQIGSLLEICPKLPIQNYVCFCTHSVSPSRFPRLYWKFVENFQ